MMMEMKKALLSKQLAASAVLAWRLLSFNGPEQVQRKRKFKPRCICMTCMRNKRQPKPSVLKNNHIRKTRLTSLLIGSIKTRGSIEILQECHWQHNTKKDTVSEIGVSYWNWWVLAIRPTHVGQMVVHVIAERVINEEWQFAPWLSLNRIDTYHGVIHAFEFT